jgi:hypothetical protein
MIQAVIRRLAQRSPAMSHFWYWDRFFSEYFGSPLSLFGNHGAVDEKNPTIMPSTGSSV